MEWRLYIRHYQTTRDQEKEIEAPKPCELAVHMRNLAVDAHAFPTNPDPQSLRRLSVSPRLNQMANSGPLAPIHDSVRPLWYLSALFIRSHVGCYLGRYGPGPTIPRPPFPAANVLVVRVAPALCLRSPSSFSFRYSLLMICVCGRRSLQLDID